MERFLDRFEGVVAAQPDYPAVCDWRRELSFQALDNASNRLGRLLNERRGAGFEVYAYLGSPGVERIVGMLGAAKAGVAFLSLDPEAPETAVRDILDTSRPLAVSLSTYLAQRAGRR